MFKKLLIASAVLAVSSSVAFANMGAAPYLGASIGSRINTVSGADRLATFNTSTDVLTILTGRRYSNAVTGKVFGGYGAMLSPCWYLGGELFIQGDANVSSSSRGCISGINAAGVRTRNVSPRTTWGYGLDIRPGYMVTDHVMAYLPVGVVRTRFSSAGNNATGVRLGLGAQTNLTPCLVLRGEYVYSRYGSSAVGGGSHVNTSQTDVGVAWMFD